MGNHVPIRVTITNESAVEFEGYFVFQIKTPRNRFTAENSGEGILSKLFLGVKGRAMEETAFLRTVFPIYIPANGTVTKTFSAGLLVENVFCVLCLENSQRDTVYSREENDFRVKASSSPRWKSGVVEEETTTAAAEWSYAERRIYEVEAASVRAEELVGLAESYPAGCADPSEQSKRRTG